MDKKEDRRIVMTKRLLKDALVEMLNEKDIYHISIRELCEKADINRSTFYKHYGSQFDLLADMENDFIDFVTKTIDKYYDKPKKVISLICHYLEENIDFVRRIINNNIDPTFANRLFDLDSIKENAMKKYNNQKSNEELEYIYNFIVYGAFRVACIWINKDNRESPDEFATLLTQLMLSA